MTETEKRYSQTEKDALAIKWAKERLRIYVLGAPRFGIVTAHKPLIPLFNKGKAKVPPRIDKWIMEMQDVDYELVYEPGKDEADPLDFLSRHPLPEIGDDKTEKIIRWNANAEQAVVVTRIREETQRDELMQRLAKRIARGNWETPPTCKTGVIGCRRTYLQRTSNRTPTSTSEESCLTRTQPRTLRKN